MMFMKNIVDQKALVPKSSLNGISLIPLTAFGLGGDKLVYFEVSFFIYNSQMVLV